MGTFATPCIKCGTKEGKLRSDGSRPIRYRGEAFGYRGMLCAGCRAGELRRAYQLGIKVARLPRGPRTSLDDAEVKARIAEVRAELRAAGWIGPESDPKLDAFKRINAARAAMERSRVAAERRAAMRHLAIGA